MMWHYILGRVFPLACLLMFWSLALYSVLLVQSPSKISNNLLNPALTSLGFSLSNVSSESVVCIGPVFVTGELLPVCNDSHQAFGYIPAPTRSIMLNALSHGVLYSPPIPRFTIRYQPVSNGPTLTFSNEYIMCDTLSDKYGVTSLYCEPLDASIDYFVDVIMQVAFSIIDSQPVKHIMLAMADLIMRVIILSICLYDLPSHLIFRLRLQILRQILYKHNFCSLYGHRYISVCVSHDILKCYRVLYRNIMKCGNWLEIFSEKSKNRDRLSEYRQKYGKAANSSFAVKKHFGGGTKRSNVFYASELMTYRVDWSAHFETGSESVYKFEDYIVEAHAQTRHANCKDAIICECPIPFIVPRLTGAQLRNVAAHHNLFVGSTWTVSKARSALLAHACNNCTQCLSTFVIQKKSVKGYQTKVK